MTTSTHNTNLARKGPGSEPANPIPGLTIHPLGLNAFPACYRFRNLLERQGVQFSADFYLEGLFRVVEVNSSQGQLFATLVGPVLEQKTRRRKGNVCFEVKVPDGCFSEESANTHDLVGRMVLLNPENIRDHPLPIKQFRVDELEVLSKRVIPNPFLYADTRDLSTHILAPVGKGIDMLAVNDLINELHEFCFLMNRQDRVFLQAVFLQRQHIRAFLTAPASTGSHHNYHGGLLVHTLQVLRNTKALIEKLPEKDSFDLSLAILCAFLHDIGKVLEYEPINSNAFQLSKIGLLLGHQNSALVILTFAWARYNVFDYERYLELAHCIAAVPRDCVQSGNRERKTLIALLVGQADRLSAANKSAVGVMPEIGSNIKGRR